MKMTVMIQRPVVPTPIPIERAILLCPLLYLFVVLDGEVRALRISDLTNASLHARMLIFRSKGDAEAYLYWMNHDTVE